ncbi:amidohydrolase family protein [Mycobacterium sp. CVI_P3]|uniref:Amidohydrolase family protein n=1 Tax=Mycobacterium pinniadriaticum TaxID=2994102 RepID=A0ABT3SP20_9MYCO|nr:amidohydrolase family protein [Mycobacterium pinniadriaticum]MCX2934875.1 amidohydrolase family protein [Mycobacterium pinniadriaticum]MCX2941284.1 amidohydrolase family protein [Mycobacterium pinniadriaticum]
MTVLIKNVRIFDGSSPRLAAGHVLIDGATIAAVESSPVAESAATTIIDGADRVLMPGMIDAHVHLVGMANNLLDLMSGSQTQLAATTLARAKGTLLRGFTTVRDMAGDTAGIKKVIDSEPTLGPRIYPSQAAISQTAGHGDFGFVYETPTALGGTESRAEMIGFMRVADGVERVLAAVREQLKLGASQIKLMVGGGAASLYDPLYTVQFTEQELAAAVQAASDYGTYVATHVYNVTGIRRAVAAGVKSIEHGHLADEPTVALLAEREVWLSTQPFAEHDHGSFLDPDSAEKNREICGGTPHVYEWATKHGVKLAWGTDLLFEPESVGRQSEMMARLGEYVSNIDALKMVTSGNAELLRLAGERDPYKSARLGEITPGAWADMLLVDGDPTADLGVLADPDTGIAVIVKDGVVVKNTL